MEERILPAILRCRRPQRSEKEKIEETLALIQDKIYLPDAREIQILISQTTESNAYSIGSKTIAITESLFQKLSPPQMAGVLSHELGHIEHKDGRLRILLYVLNLPTTLLKKGFLYLINQRSMVITSVCFFGLCVIMHCHALEMMYMQIRDVIIWFLLQTAIFLMANQDMQDSEWRADEFAASHGLGQELKEALLQMTTENVKETEREALMDNYPDLAERIHRLESLQNPIGA